MDKEPKFDTSRFDRNFPLMLQTTKRTWEESRLRSAYFFSKRALKMTPATSKDTIRTNLVSPTRISPTLKVQELIANKIRQNKGMPWLNGNKLRIQGNKYGRKAVTGSGVVRVGWLNPIKKLAQYVPNKSGAASTPAGVKQVGTEKGGASISLTPWNPKISVWNSYQGSKPKWNGRKRTTSKVQSIIIKYAQQALDYITAQDIAYLKRKLGEGFEQFNRA